MEKRELTAEEIEEARESKESELRELYRQYEADQQAIENTPLEDFL